MPASVEMSATTSTAPGSESATVGHAVEVGDDDPGAAGVEAAGEGGADAACGPGDDDVAILEIHTVDRTARMRVTERQRGNGQQRPAWPGNAVNDRVTFAQCATWKGTAGYRARDDRTARPPAPDAHDAVITEALAVIDQALAQMLRRELVSSNEVADLLLDVRTRAHRAVPSRASDPPDVRRCAGP